MPSFFALDQNLLSVYMETLQKVTVTQLILKYPGGINMRKIQLSLMALLISVPVFVLANPTHSDEHAHQMDSKTATSAASQEYMQGMQGMHEGMMQGLKESDADRAFAKGMIEHHKGAIAMAETELKYGKDPVMRELAEDVIKAQTAEIDHMEAWLSK